MILQIKQRDKNKVYIIIGKNKNNKKWKEQENVIFLIIKM